MYLMDFKKNKSKGKYKIAQDATYTGDDYWDWSVWIEATEPNLDKIESVIYNLHETFLNPVRTITSRSNKFKLETSGWGGFTIYARINFKDKTILECQHELELFYPDGDNNES